MGPPGPYLASLFLTKRRRFCMIFHRSNDTTASPILKVRINNQILAPELRVIGEDGENIGVMKRSDALALARPDEGIDLIEISPNAVPPVARIMSFDKYRYQVEKAEKAERKAQKQGGLKNVQISARAATNDLMIKIRHLEEFLNEGNQVEISMRLRGREKGNKPWANEKLEAFLKMIPVEYRVISPVKYSGNGLSMQIAKKK